MSTQLQPLERYLLLACLALIVVAVLGPPISNPAHYHAFADQVVWAGVAHVSDVLSNAAFAVWGLLGLVSLRALPFDQVMPKQRLMAGLFFVGLITTTVGSGYYHLQPDDVRLVWDRLGMVVAFSGLLGLAAAGAVGERAGLLLARAILLLGPLSLWVSQQSDNILPWVVVQVGGMALILWMAHLDPKPGALAVRWGIVILVYMVAKLLELGDHQVYAWTNHLVSGHSLKHVVASLAAWPIWLAVRRASVRMHNPVRMTIAKGSAGPRRLDPLQETTCR